MNRTKPWNAGFITLSRKKKFLQHRPWQPLSVLRQQCVAEIHYCTAVTLYFSGVVQGEQTAACESLSDKKVDGDRKKKRDKEFESARSRVKNSKRQMETEWKYRRTAKAKAPPQSLWPLYNTLTRTATWIHMLGGELIGLQLLCKKYEGSLCKALGCTRHVYEVCLCGLVLTPSKWWAS